MIVNNGLYAAQTGGKWARPGMDPELDFGGLFHLKSSLTLLFAIWNIAVWGAMPPGPLDMLLGMAHLYIPYLALNSIE